MLKLLEPLSYRVPATQEELDSFVQTMIQWEEINSRHIPGNLYDNITCIFNGSPQHNMMRTYFQESRGPSSRVFTGLEDGHEGAFHGHLPVRDQDGLIADWKEQAEQASNDWMASFPVGLNSENEFLSALIGHDEIFQESQHESRYDGPPAWTGSSSSYPDQAWYGQETSAPGFSSQAWNHQSSALLIITISLFPHHLTHHRCMQPGLRPIHTILLKAVISNTCTWHSRRCFRMIWSRAAMGPIQTPPQMQANPIRSQFILDRISRSASAPEPERHLPGVF